MVGNRNTRDNCIGRIGLHLSFSRAVRLTKKFANFMKISPSVKRFSGISNFIPECAHPLTFFTGVAFEH